MHNLLFAKNLKFKIQNYSTTQFISDSLPTVNLRREAINRISTKITTDETLTQRYRIILDFYLIFEIHVVGRAQAHKTQIWWAIPTLLHVYFSRYSVQIPIVHLICTCLFGILFFSYRVLRSAPNTSATMYGNSGSSIHPPEPRIGEINV